MSTHTETGTDEALSGQSTKPIAKIVQNKPGEAGQEVHCLEPF